MNDHDTDKAAHSQSKSDATKTPHLARRSEGGTDMPAGETGGEDEGSAPIEGDDSHLNEDQKPKY